MDLSTPIVMGILNVTPDSFFDGNRYQTEKNILNRAEDILNHGGSIIDVGGYSSRPGSKNITIDQELNRVIPAIDLIHRNFPEAVISIDTFRSKVAKEAIEIGGSMVNDISAGDLDSKMFDIISDLNVPYIIMHMKGNPQNMQNAPQYQNINQEIIYQFSKKINELSAKGIADVIIDPGFGFGKTLEHNYQILNQLEIYQSINAPLLIGASRKSMIHKLLEIDAKDALNGTTVVNTIGLSKGASILRVHDVKEAIEVITISSYTKEINY